MPNITVCVSLVLPKENGSLERRVSIGILLTFPLCPIIISHAVVCEVR